MTATAIPTRDSTMILRDGRALAYSEWGDLHGRPVVLHHGRPSSRLFCPDIEATEAAGVRLITIDRPGYGGSDPLDGVTHRQFVADFEELAEQLSLPACPSLGWSGGGPYALASAVYAPGRVTSVGLAAVITPIDEHPGAWDALPSAARALFQLLRQDRAAAMSGIRQYYQWYADGWQEWVATFGTDPTDPDFPVDVRVDVHEACITWFGEGARQGSTGLIADAIAGFLPWGFSVGDVRQPVHIWWGEADPIGSLTKGRWLAAAIPASTLVEYPGEGHMVPVSHWAEMLAALH